MEDGRREQSTLSGKNGEIGKPMCVAMPARVSIYQTYSIYFTDAKMSSYHPADTCRMGRDGDDSAMLDAKLRVRGVDGLRVVDASVMPLLMGGHPQMAVYAIAEKAADIIKMGMRQAR